MGIRSLEHQVREAAVHAELRSVLYLGIALVCGIVAIRERMDVPESKERFQADCRLGGTL